MNKVAIGQPAPSQMRKQVVIEYISNGADSFGNKLLPQHIEHLISEGFAGVGIRGNRRIRAIVQSLDSWVVGRIHPSEFRIQESGVRIQESGEKDIRFRILTPLFLLTF